MTADKSYKEDIVLIKQYSTLYVNFLNKKIDKIETRSFKNKIPKEVIKYIEFFAELDYEFKKYGKHPKLTQDGSNIFSRKYIKDKNWRGYWLKATAIDCDLFVNWLISQIEYEEYQNCNLEKVYLEAHPKEKYVPYSIKIANIMFTKYYK